MNYLGKYYLKILIFFAIMGGIGLYNLSLRPQLPLAIGQTSAGLKIVKDLDKDSVPNLENSTITSVENIPVKERYELDDIIDRKKIGDKVFLKLSDGQKYSRTLVAPNLFSEY